jgi:hypothetical protein
MMERRNYDLVTKLTQKVRGKMCGNNPWGDVHYRMWTYGGEAKPFATAMRLMIRGLAVYADAARDRFDAALGDDYALGASWDKAVSGVYGLLNGELDGLDNGTIQEILCRLRELNGFEGDLEM